MPGVPQSQAEPGEAAVAPQCEAPLGAVPERRCEAAAVQPLWQADEGIPQPLEAGQSADVALTRSAAESPGGVLAAPVH